MVILVYKTIKGKKYAYLKESFRIGKKVRNISKYVGPKNKVNNKTIKDRKTEFEKELIKKKATLISKILSKKIKKFEYPINIEEIKKIEEMNLNYKKIIKTLHPKNIQDLNRRLLANYVFESNALEGNSLTLKNVTEVIFENRIAKGKDLREIYDAQNSYKIFLSLQKTKKKLNHNFIIMLHSGVMHKIDDRLGYREVPVVLVGKPRIKLTKPENIYQEMNELLNWYEKYEDKIYPLELAFKFHAKFEKIHPFCDGNGRVGRLLLNYILMYKGYFPIIIRKTSRESYLKSLEVADHDKWIILMRFALKHYKETFRKFFDIYSKYI